MKKSILFLIVIAFASLSIQLKAQQVIASAGGYYEGENISLSWTLGEPVTETFSAGGVILTQGFQQPYNFYIQQILNIPAGWSGVSSYIDPMNKGVEGIFTPYENDLVILASMSQFYYPAEDVNTIGNWDYHTGYQIKAENEFTVTLTGTRIANSSINLADGWNLIPVLSSCEVPVENVFNGFEPLEIVKQVAGPYLYWPEYNINTLESLVPGKAYFVASSDAGTVSYPACAKSTPINKWQDSKPSNFTPWNELQYTASSHAIAFPADVLAGSGIKVGDVIGTFTPEGLCAGRIEITNLSSNFAIMAFGNDETTTTKDGFEAGEMLQFKVFRPEGSEEINVTVEFNPALPQQGLFVNQGMSAVKTLKLDSIGLEESGGILTEIYPNPSHGIFTLTMSSWPEKMQIHLMDASGQIIKTFKPGSKLNGSAYAFNMSDLPNGVYFLKLVDSGYLEIKKVVIN
jgi:hypothetical protein